VPAFLHRVVPPPYEIREDSGPGSIEFTAREIYPNFSFSDVAKTLGVAFGIGQMKARIRCDFLMAEALAPEGAG
jgi:hypothetical protein